MILHGSCFCGDIRYEVEGDLLLPGHCHCSICRKVHGAAFGTYADARLSEFRWAQGEDLVRSFESSPGSLRFFCPRCGSPLACKIRHSPETIGITLGTLDDDPGVRPLGHVFVRSKAPWDTITDTLPQFETWPPGMGPDDET